jgi:hypothetical protein
MCAWKGKVFTVSYKQEHLDEILQLANIHEHEEQRVRQRNARKCVIISIDKEAQTATFKGSGKKPYTTDFDGCTCQDFGMRKLPCKHMYRLAHELGKFNLDEVPEGRVSESSRARVAKKGSEGLYTKNHLEEIRAMDNIHEHEEQRARQFNAQDCVIISIDKEARTATFKEWGQKPYITTPERCTCQDFGMRHLPCKHIYRLLYECGLFDYNPLDYDIYDFHS